MGPRKKPAQRQLRDKGPWGDSAWGPAGSRVWGECGGTGMVHSSPGATGYVLAGHTSRLGWEKLLWWFLSLRLFGECGTISHSARVGFRPPASPEMFRRVSGARSLQHPWWALSRPHLNCLLLITWGKGIEKNRSGVRVTQLQECLFV